MAFVYNHANINVTDLARSIAFYEAALGLREARRIEAKDGSFTIVFLRDGVSPAGVELTYLRDKEGPYDLGDNESHLAFATDDLAQAHARHEQMGCICFENEEMGIYFIEDPDGYWIEIVPA
nr:VOC family protein [Maliibacterium massiliense]